MAKEGYVTIELFKDDDRYKDDVFVGVNGVGYQIKRGEPVDVPVVVAEVIRQQMAQDRATAHMIEVEGQKYKRKEKELS